MIQITMTYGTGSAPYLVMRCLEQIAIECEKQIQLFRILLGKTSIWTMFSLALNRLKKFY